MDFESTASTNSAIQALLQVHIDYNISTFVHATFFYLNSDGQGHVQSLILCAIVLILSFICYMLAIVGDLFSINRKILETKVTGAMVFFQIQQL